MTDKKEKKPMRKEDLDKVAGGHYKYDPRIANVKSGGGGPEIIYEDDKKFHSGDEDLD
jgi:hypothetical protein